MEIKGTAPQRPLCSWFPVWGDIGGTRFSRGSFLNSDTFYATDFGSGENLMYRSQHWSTAWPTYLDGSSQWEHWDIHHTAPGLRILISSGFDNIRIRLTVYGHQASSKDFSPIFTTLRKEMLKNLLKITQLLWKEQGPEDRQSDSRAAVLEC